MRPETYHEIVSGRRRGFGAAAARAGFRIASWPYGLAMRVRNGLYGIGWTRTFRAAVPVVSVGNLTLGGTGKTPCVEWVAGWLRDRGFRPVILSRGYGAEHHRNDEAMVLEENLPDVPHLQGADRAALARTAVEELDAEVLVLDDGFQHRRLRRDVDLVLLDATAPLARESIFPRGMLREPVAGLKRASAAILTRCDLAHDTDEQVAWLKRRFPTLPVAKAIHTPLELVGLEGSREALALLANRPVAAICGIGNPAAFRATLAKLGATPVAMKTYPDHHAYTRADVQDLTRWADDLPADAIVATTQKDWVKLRLGDLSGRPMWAVKIGFEIVEGRAGIDELLERIPQPVSVEDAAEGEESRA
jgi:tetraacyldisaccharide 4'-kinase